MIKNKIVSLLDDIARVFRFDAWENTDKIADYLISNGVTVTEDIDCMGKQIGVEGRGA